MRATLLRLATPAKYLTPGNRTGLAGVLTHPSPRSELVAIYTATLSKLSKFPAHSSYRNSTESLTKHRLAQVESITPAGWNEWKPKADALLKKYPNLFKNSHWLKSFIRYDVDGKVFISEKLVPELDEEEIEADLSAKSLSRLKVHLRPEQRTEETERLLREADLEGENEIGESEWIPEPKLDADQISQLEDKIGAGLIEEVIDVAKGELQLVDTMLQAQVWEELQDKPAPGQWDYFQRDRNVSGTQEPPKV